MWIKLNGSILTFLVCATLNIGAVTVSPQSGEKHIESIEFQSAFDLMVVRIDIQPDLGVVYYTYPLENDDPVSAWKEGDAFQVKSGVGDAVEIPSSRIRLQPINPTRYINDEPFRVTVQISKEAMEGLPKIAKITPLGGGNSEIKLTDSRKFIFEKRGFFTRWNDKASDVIQSFETGRRQPYFTTNSVEAWKKGDTVIVETWRTSKMNYRLINLDLPSNYLKKTTEDMRTVDVVQSGAE